MRTDRERLADILEAIERIREEFPATKEDLGRSRLLQVWVVYHLQVIGEAANHISRTLIDGYPEIPWQGIIDMRHVLVHQYFGIDLDTVWRTVIHDLPVFESSIRTILDELTR